MLQSLTITVKLGTQIQLRIISTHISTAFGHGWTRLSPYGLLIAIILSPPINHLRLERGEKGVCQNHKGIGGCSKILCVFILHLIQLVNTLYLYLNIKYNNNTQGNNRVDLTTYQQGEGGVSKNAKKKHHVINGRPLKCWQKLVSR